MNTSFIKVIDNAAKLLIFNRFKEFFSLTDVNADCVFCPKTIAQRKIAEKRGAAVVEFISVWRGGIQYDWPRNNTFIARRGLMMEYGDSSAGGGGKANIITIKAVPTEMNYDIWLWSRDLDKVMRAVESYLKWQHDSPFLKIFYNGRYEMDMYFEFGPASDETDYSIYEKGLYYVHRLPLKVHGWVLTEVETKTVLKIVLDLFLREGTAPNYTDTLIDEYVIEVAP